MDEKLQFNIAFGLLTGHKPFPWQERLYREFKAARFPACNLPTGLGKTSLIAIWLIALGSGQPNLPRRLVYVVNRRTIVDQATREAEKLQAKLADVPELQSRLQSLCAAKTDVPLAISTLRGQFADNGEWSADPARPAIIVGTVDMIGSRLLFSGYGRGFKHRPLHAGFLGQDVLLVHDEAHLEPAFQHLLDEIRKEQTEGRCKDFRPMHILPLTATPRADANKELFTLTDADFQDKIVKQRLEAVKRITLHSIKDEKETSGSIAALALERAKSHPDSAILVFVRTVEDVKRVTQVLEKAHRGQIQPLTGTLRGLERDRMADPRRTDSSPVFARFLKQPKPSAGSKDQWNVMPALGTVFLVCTSAGEVGVDISADHLICDLTPLDSMAQRFGRVNRYGEGNALIDVVHAGTFDKNGKDKEYQASREKTLAILKDLNGDGSPRALSWLAELDRPEAFSPIPEIPHVSDILFDAWALTSICLVKDKDGKWRDPLPGRPPVADWLHGVPTEWQPPETHVAWRDEVQLVVGDLLAEYDPEELLDVYPLKPHEILKDRSKRVFDELKRMAKRLDGERKDDNSRGEVPVWIQDDRGVEVTTLQKIVDGDEGAISDKTIILPPSVGGLAGGMLDGGAGSADDVADEWFEDDERKTNRRQRTRHGEPDAGPPQPRMRLVQTIDLKSDDGLADSEPGDDDEGASRPDRFWKWWVKPRSSDDDMSKSAGEKQELLNHLEKADRHAAEITRAVGLNEMEANAVRLAARWHDLGKDRAVWQRSIGNDDYFKNPTKVLAKSGATMRPVDLGNYRHELGSLVDLRSQPEFQNLTEEARDLILHLVAAHHGRARPHFPAEEAIDPEHEGASVQMARDVPARFARLQRKYGRWGLAYLESLVRAADILASQSKDGAA